MSGMRELVKQAKEQKGIQKGKNKGLTSYSDLVYAYVSETDVAKSLKVIVCDPMPGNAKTQKSHLNQTEGGMVMQ